MADDYSSWMTNPPADTPWQRLAEALTVGLYHTPQERFRARVNEQALIDRYNQLHAQTPEVQTGAELQTARNRAELPQVPDEAAARLARLGQDQVQSRANVTGLLNEYGQPASEAPRSVQPFMAQPEVFSAGEAPPVVPILQPSSVGDDGNLSVPGWDEDAKTEAQAAARYSGGNGSTPGLAQMVGPVQRGIRDWSAAFQTVNGRAPTAQEAQQYLSQLQLKVGGRAPSTEEMMYQRFLELNGGDVQKALNAFHDWKKLGGGNSMTPEDRVNEAKRRTYDRLSLLPHPSPQAKKRLQELENDPAIVTYRGQKAVAPKATPQLNEDKLRQDAKAAIANGAPKDQVAARFKQMTGKDL